MERNRWCTVSGKELTFYPAHGSGKNLRMVMHEILIVGRPVQVGYLG